MVFSVLRLTLWQPMSHSSVLLLNFDITLNFFARQSLQDPRSHQIYIKALTGDQTDRKEELVSLLADTCCCKPSGQWVGIATAEQTHGRWQGLLLLQLKFGNVGTREGKIFFRLYIFLMVLYARTCMRICQKGKDQWFLLIEDQLRLPFFLLLRLWNDANGNTYLLKELRDPLPSLFAWGGRHL